LNKTLESDKHWIEAEDQVKEQEELEKFCKENKLKETDLL